MSLATSAYRGTRDFYPDAEQFSNLPKEVDLYLYQRYIFETWRQALLKLGFVEYDASLLENAQIYIQKSGEELGSKQLYSFVDKGQRQVALRPEMTPTLARMVADKYQQLRFPLRWFSIPNCFRYERPQKGRLREFWQLNVDILGLQAGAVDLEILLVVVEVMKAFGATEQMFEIRLNHRQVLYNYLKSQSFEDSQISIVYQLLDDYHKDPEFEKKLKSLKSSQNQQGIENLLKLLSSFSQSSEETQEKLDYLQQADKFAEMRLVLGRQEFREFYGLLGNNLKLDPTIVRGLAYYNGLVFECFDKNKSNPRALFGGGRYDNLLDIFGQPTLPAIGFGMGDVTIFEFLKNWRLLDGHPKFETWKKTYKLPKVGLIPFSWQDLKKIYVQIIPALQQENKTWEIDYDFQRSERKRFENLKKRGCTQILKIQDA